MQSEAKEITRREFISAGVKTVAAYTVLSPMMSSKIEAENKKQLRLAIVGTGHRGSGMWGKDIVERYGKETNFVGLCDINTGRLEFAKSVMKVSCPVFTDLDRMIIDTKPDIVLVNTPDGTHHTMIEKAMELGCEVITEKPLTTEVNKLQIILDAQKKFQKKIVVAFNYRYTPHRAKIKELLMSGRIGKITSVDFNWYLDVYHGADYFRRWHRLREHSGSLLVHKATHHFDLLNWWIDSEPEFVHAFGSLEFYGKNNSFRSANCRSCPHTGKCKFYFDITKDKRLMNLYVNNEKYDGYFRDGCVWREDVDIFDKMSVQIKYLNNVQVSYSLTTYSPYEGYRIAFNGTDGRLEAWIHERQPWQMDDFDEIQITDNFGQRELIKIPQMEGGHGGGDILMQDKIFKGTPTEDKLKQAAGLRDGALSVLIGIAARTSIDTGKVIKISDLIRI